MEKKPGPRKKEFLKNIVKLRPCAVCEADSTGYHFGVFSCEACKVSKQKTLQHFFGVFITKYTPSYGEKVVVSFVVHWYQRLNLCKNKANTMFTVDNVEILSFSNCRVSSGEVSSGNIRWCVRERVGATSSRAGRSARLARLVGSSAASKSACHSMVSAWHQGHSWITTPRGWSSFFGDSTPWQLDCYWTTGNLSLWDIHFDLGVRQ